MDRITLDRVRDKIGRAEKHLKDLQLAINDSLQTRYNAHLTWEQAKREGKPIPFEPPPVIWSLAIGDCIHNLRSSLDHLACRLAVLNEQPESVCKRTTFPLFLDDNSTAKDVFAKKVQPFVSENALTLIKFFQPYNGTDGREFYNLLRRRLWRLAQLDIIDKHRMLVVFDEWVRLDHVDVHVDDRPFVRHVPKNPVWEPAKHRAELTLLYGFNEYAAQPEVEMRPTYSFDIAFADTEGVCDGRPVMAELGRMIRAVTRVVDEFDGAFFR